MLLWATLALAAPVEGLRPVVAPADVQAQHDAFRKERGLTPEPLACRPLWPRHAVLCFRVWEQGTRRWVTRADLTTWKTDADALLVQVTTEAGAHLDTVELAQVVGMEAHYLKHLDADGWAAAGVLDPAALSDRLGGLPIHVAVPAGSVLLAWRAGDPELDQVMAIGVAELFESQAGGVSTTVYEWDGEHWRSFGRARPATPDEDGPGAPADEP